MMWGIFVVSENTVLVQTAILNCVHVPLCKLCMRPFVVAILQLANIDGDDTQA